MTAKRFRIYQDIYEVLYIEDVQHYSDKRLQKGYIIGHEEDVKYEDVLNVVELLNALHEENQELRQDNDIKFWKHQFMMAHNSNQVILHELSLAMNEGYEVSDKFKEWLDNLTEKREEVIKKHERLFE